MKPPTENITLRDPATLELHPLVACLPMFGPHTPEMEELRTRIDNYGWEEMFLSIDEDGLLFDGRHTRELALEQNIEQVQCRVYPRDEVSGRIRAYGMGRTHLGTKSAKAYWWWPFFAANAYSHGGDRRSKASDSLLKNPGNQHSKVPRANHSLMVTNDEIAEQLGVSIDLVKFAKAAHEFFAEKPQMKAKLEPRILSGELPLNRVLCARGREGYDDGSIDLSGRNDHYNHALECFGKTTKHLVVGWEKLDLEDKGRLAAGFSEILSNWPEDLADTMLRSLKSLAKERAGK